MIVTNGTALDTSKLRVELYDWAKKAHISTKGLVVTVKPAKSLHGLCCPRQRWIKLWSYDGVDPTDFGYLWVHELCHLKPRNVELWTSGHKRKCQQQAYALAQKVTGRSRGEVNWHRNKYQVLLVQRSGERADYAMTVCHEPEDWEHPGAVEAYNAGASLTELAFTYGSTRSGIYSWLIRHGAEMRRFR